MIYQEILETFKKNGSIVTSVGNEIQYTDSGSIPEHCVQLAGEYEKRIVGLMKSRET